MFKQSISARNMRELLADSPIVASHRGPGCTRVQDAYSLRCAPIVSGAARDTANHAFNVAQAELASAVDNPVVTLDGRIESNGNFHGAPVAYVLDYLAIALADVASMSERRIDRFLDKSRNNDLPPFHVSMGWAAGRKLRRSIDGLQRVVAIELLTAARGIALRAPLQAGPNTKPVVDRLRAAGAEPGPDRFMSPDIESIVVLVASGELLELTPVSIH